MQSGIRYRKIRVLTTQAFYIEIFILVGIVRYLFSQTLFVSLESVVDVLLMRLLSSITNLW